MQELDEIGIKRRKKKSETKSSRDVYGRLREHKTESGRLTQHYELLCAHAFKD